MNEISSKKQVENANSQPHLYIGTSDYGGVNLTMSIHDYLNSLAENDRIEIAYYYEKCMFSVHWYYRQYGVLSDVPTILANTTNSIKAAASSNNTIIISRGVIEHAKACHPSEHLTEFKLTQQQWTELSIFWVVAHECSHLARGHLAMKRDGVGTYYAYEYDADCLAAAALYRFIWANHLINFPMYSREAKSIALNVAYWCITMLPDYEIASPAITHPSWEERLIYIHQKLVFMDVPNVNNGLTKQFIDEKRFLDDKLVGIDVAYSRKRGLPKEEWKIVAWAEKHFGGKPSLLPIISQWEPVVPHLPKYSKLPMDRYNYRPRYGYEANVSFGPLP